ncbi:MAG TPA: hypothetical protein ENK52_05830 [Saprospiraceae bacterium]|nr:hypothetical protein [Saprospiraceae bacterium]
MKYKVLFLSAIIFLIACQQDKKAQLKELNLLQYGIPITILAPDSSKVIATEIMGIKDITIKSGSDYAIQLYASDVTTTDVQQLVADQKKLVKDTRYFAKIVREEPDGFIYQTVIDTSTINFDFRYVLVKGDKEYVFQTGLLGSFSEEAVEQMFNAVKPKSKRK